MTAFGFQTPVDVGNEISQELGLSSSRRFLSLQGICNSSERLEDTHNLQDNSIPRSFYQDSFGYSYN
jgi:hypothetical protein